MKKSFKTLFLLTFALLLALNAVACWPVSVITTQPDAAATSNTVPSQGNLDLCTVPPEEKPAETAAPKPAASESAVSAAPTTVPSDTPSPEPTEAPVKEDGIYDSKEEVALYLYLYGHLPSNYITKKEAQSLGWSGGSLEPYAPGKCIGGDYFGNYEKLLPSKKGRSYYECDIGTLGARSRGSKRIVWSNDGLIYYTGDHYESYTLLYGEE